MTTDHNSPCELILKIGCNEYDEISSAITSLLRSCSIINQSFFYVERQIQPTTCFGSFTTPTSRSRTPIQSQSLSCVIFLTDDIFQQQSKKEFFKSANIWNFHHKIELLDEHRHIIARQDYYELSHSLPLWSISHIPYNRHIIIRFNIFTNNFDTMLRFYTHLFRRHPDSSKSGFVLFNLSSMIDQNLLYQFSIKYSPSIESYPISQGAYFKFRLHNLNQFLHEYASKLFTINKSEYYIYDPDGNLLHLYLHNLSSTTRECMSSKAWIHTNDSGFGDSSDPSIHLLKTNISQMYTINHDIDGQSHSSIDSGQCSSISSNEINAIKRTIHCNSVSKMNNISVRSATKREIDCQLKQQQQRTVFPRIPLGHQQWKPSLYESEPRLSNIDHNNRYYSSINDMKKFNQIRPMSTNRVESFILNHVNDGDISYEVDSPRTESELLADQPSIGYLNAFLLKKQQQQQSIQSRKVKQLVAQFEKPTITSRPKSVPLFDQFSSGPSKSIKSSSQQSSTRGTMTPISEKSLQLCSKPFTFEWQNDESGVLDTTNEQINDLFDQTRSPRINIGITLDSRLRKTPVLDMLRSTTMEPDIIESRHLNRTNSFIPIARF